MNTKKTILTVTAAFVFNLGLTHAANPDQPVKKVASQFVPLEQISSQQAKLAVFSETPLQRGAKV